MHVLFRLSSLLAVALLISPAFGQDKENPIVTEVKANLKDPAKPFVMYIHVKIKDGTAAKFESAFAKCRTATRKEKGNKAYILTRSIKMPNEYIVYERWDNLKALEEHIKLKHTVALLAEIGEMLDGPPTVKVYLPTRD